ncbi:MAG: hypothetical protein AAFO69_16235, partial [Bacteroidota bacterium]
MKKGIIHLFVALFLCYACDTKKPTVQEDIVETNPALPGFDAAGSDQKAIAIADAVMENSGGRAAWDAMGTLVWNFLGARKLTWDKPSGKVRIDNLRAGGGWETIIVNLKDTSDVQLKMGGELIVQADSLNKYGSMGRSIWINDSYWIVMPFKLKDSGVTLKYVKEDTTATGEPAHILQLTFKDVGDTPQNKYEVAVSKERKLVAQWAFYREKDQEKPNFLLPWDDYKNYNGLMLASNRGQRTIS